ncbi:small multi-drug export protein [Proteiniborus sp. MB09-C3]|uniref:COG2426 family protein n=1 Tax=Proteiniborus sp. MB09-C3 TaxID=3050072 RepID=UPI00255672CF|nr:small multi-drug export protein [Proteiniborus sp. MB09-C3]WIV12108.1 small multi-drug export protein [Proteiniborus sp. MB09-C3]
MGSFLNEIFSFLSVEFTVMLTAALPIIELRGAIPVGISLGLSPLHSTILSFIGSMIPVPFILFTIRPIFNHLKKTRAFKKLVHKITVKSFNKSGKIQKYGAWGLLVFVAIPLPGTGVWSGSLAAALLDMRFKWAFPAIFVGNLIAGIIIMGVSYEVFKVIVG